MTPISQSPIRGLPGERGAPVVSLPTELWQEIAKRFSTHEWVRTCGSVCRAFHDLQPLHIDVYVGTGDEGHAALRWTARHWQQAVSVDLHLGYFREQDIKNHWVEDISETLEGASEAAAAQSVTISMDPQLFKYGPMMTGNSDRVAAYLKGSLQSCWKNIEELDIYAHFVFPIPTLHKLRILHLHVMTFHPFEELLASIRSLAQLEQLHLSFIFGGTLQPESFDVGCLGCLKTLVLDRIAPKAVELPSALTSIEVTGDADAIEDATWLSINVPLRALSLTSFEPISDNLRSLLHAMRHSPVERVDLENTCGCLDDPVPIDPVEHFSMGCALEGATVLPPFPALKSIRICTHGNVSIVIPAESHVEELWLRADVVDFSTEDWRSFAARMQSVTFFFNQIRGAGFRDLQTLHACGNMKVREHAWYCELSPGVSTARLFSASRIVEGADEPEGSSEEEESEDESEIEEGIEDRSISGESELW